MPQCQHEYHEECIVEWCSQNNTCPTCKAQIDMAALPANDPIAVARQQFTSMAQDVVTRVLVRLQKRASRWAIFTHICLGKKENVSFYFMFIFEKNKNKKEIKNSNSFVFSNVFHFICLVNASWRANGLE